MPLLREPTTTTVPTDVITELTRAASATGSAAAHGRRRGSRVRARMVRPRLRRARRNAWDIEALRLPAPLLTDPATAEPMADPVVAADPALSTPLTPEAGDTADWQPEPPVRAIDLSDRPRVIISPGPELIQPDLIQPDLITPDPIAPDQIAANPIAPSKPGPPKGPGPAKPAAPPSPAKTPPADWSSSTQDAIAAPELHSLTASNAFSLTPGRVFDDAVTAGTIAHTQRGQTQVPDPAQQVTVPSRIPEALLAAVLSVVATLAAWGTAAPSQAWVPLAILPAVGLLALLLPGADPARLTRAGAVLAAAACLPVMAPSMAPVTLVVALAAVVTYPALVGQWAGRTIVGLAVGSLATPLVIEALTVGPHPFDVLLDPAGGALTAVRLTLGSGILVVALIGSLALTTRRTLTSTASMAVARERTARAATSQANLASGLDSVTGLPNRDALLRAVTIALDGGLAAKSRPAQVGLVLVEIDRFADLADSLGATLADDVAEQVAGRLRAEYPMERMLARVGRHQFAVLLTGATSDSCATVARWITVLMNRPIVSRGRDLSITCSMGAALAGPGLSTADDLLQAADEACRAAQRSGRARWVMFDQAVRGATQSQATLEIELRDAVGRGAIEVAFQPVLALGTGDNEDRIVGAEALARWTRLDGTMIEPLRFIPMADEIGLGTVLGMQVIERALSALVIWRHEGVGVDQVWVNLAPSQLNDPEFAHEVAAQLAIRGLASSCLVLEISSSRLPESEQALSTLGMLRSLGIAVALDDFGRSGTSLSALRRLPISAVKLDHTLAAELGQQDAVPRSVAQLCRTLGLRVVIEGVETVVQLHAAREIGADAVQGFAIARPMSAEDITNLLTLRLPRDFRLR